MELEWLHRIKLTAEALSIELERLHRFKSTAEGTFS
ncbi:hypothetical protein DFP95_11746 [Cohnella lupini]|uniref:Uncharacterized protein n=1 Tax=Cohnella lupini TaxID=1294267 RepID=A0A3D9I169_9BACL|nr:hypothetical protein DFP95_11746 [Cohnella lupini]